MTLISTEVEVKKCSNCKEEKPKTAEYFYRDRASKSGFKSRCKICEGNSYAINGRYGLFNIKWKELAYISGIYKITCKGNGKIYIGSAVNFCMRWSCHYDNLKKNKHENDYMQNAWNKYGKDSFLFEIVEFVDEHELLIKREQYWLDKTKCYNREIGFNILKFAGSALGNKLKQSTKDKLKLNGNRPIIQYTKKGEYIAEYTGAREAARINNLSHGQIGLVAKGKKKLYKDFIWVYKNGNFTLEDALLNIINTSRTVLQYDLKGNFIKEWDMNIRELSDLLGKEFINIPNVVNSNKNSLGGYMWRYRNSKESILNKIEPYTGRIKKRRVE